MRKDEVPQDNSKMMDHCRELCYAVDESGNYITVKSSGWEVKQIVNDQAWELIEEKVRDVRNRVLAGELSPLAYYMAKNQMDTGLLSEYTGFSRRKIKKHLDPEYYKKIEASILERYAKVFSMTVDELKEMDRSSL